MHHEPFDNVDDTPHARTLGRRGTRRRGQRHGDGPHHRGGRHGGRGAHRARRGAVQDGIVLLLGDRPMHGYELITELEAKSGGRWRPSPGAIYPALDKLEQRGLITATAADGKRQFALTERGREVRDTLVETAAGTAPWDESSGDRGEMRRQLAELAGQIRQLARFGSSAQLAAADDILTRAIRELYAVLARTDDADRADAPDAPASAQPDENEE